MLIYYNFLLANIRLEKYVIKFVTDWLFTIKMIKTLSTALYADDGLLFFDKDSGNATFCYNEKGFLSVNVKNISLDDTYCE